MNLFIRCVSCPHGVPFLPLFFWIGSNTLQPKMPAEVVYKKLDGVSLRLILYYPHDYSAQELYPVIIFFHGGGWNSGDTLQFSHHAEYFACRGAITALASYRVKSRNGTTPFEAVKDAKSAVRFLRTHAEEMRIDPEKVIASGGSAGGHLAAAAGNVIGLEEEGEDLNISSKPDALVLFNPVVDNGPSGFGYEVIGDRYLEVSPFHNVRDGSPPTIFFLGTNDKFIPPRTAIEYKRKMDEVKSRCDLLLYEGRGHGFFNHRFTPYYQETVYQADSFLVSTGFLKGVPLISNTQVEAIRHFAEPKHD